MIEADPERVKQIEGSLHAIYEREGHSEYKLIRHAAESIAYQEALVKTYKEIHIDAEKRAKGQ